MSDRDFDVGAAYYWRFAAYIFGALGTICWIIFAVLLGDESREPNATPWLWMAAAVSLTVFSGTSAVLSALKAMEGRLHSELYVVRREQPRGDI